MIRLVFLVGVALAGCASVERSPTTAEEFERLLRRRWPRDFVLEYCRPASCWHPMWQALVPMGDLHLDGELYPGDGRLGPVTWEAHRFNGELSYQLCASKGDLRWILEIGNETTLRKPLGLDEVVQKRIAIRLTIALQGGEHRAYQVLISDDVDALRSSDRLVWKSQEHGTLDVELDGTREPRVFRVDGKEDAELLRLYRAREGPP